MIPIRPFAAAALMAALTACTQSSYSDSPATVADLSKKAKVVTFDVSGMT